MAEKEFLDFCSFLSGVSLASVPQSVVDHAKLVLLDTLGVVIAGSQNAEVDKIAKHLCLIGNRDRSATWPGRQERFNPLDAALVSGISGSSLEYEEGNSRAMGHPLNPLTGEEVSQKFLSLAGPVIGDKRAEQFLEKLKNLESEKHIQE